MNVYQRLNEARKAFHSREIKKTGKNKFAGYEYFELADFVVPALEIFAEKGLTAVISFSEHDAVMDIFNAEVPDERISITSPIASAQLKGCHPVQNLGATQTYLRRYLWVLALEIVEHDAVDSSRPVEKSEEFDAELFVDAMLDWVKQARSEEELTSLWVGNKKQIASLKKSDSELYLKLQSSFSARKKSLEES